MNASAIQLRYVLTDELEPSELLRALELLSPEERVRYQLLKLEPVRRAKLAARALLRSELSRRASLSPASFQFSEVGAGRPVVSEPSAARDVWFSVAHTRGLAVCALGMTPHLGIDVEPLDRDASAALHMLTRVERLLVGSLSGAARRRFLLERWTLKEAYAKAMNTSLWVGGPSVAFFRGNASEIREAIDPQAPGHALPWSFELHTLHERYLLAIAVAFASPLSAAPSWTIERSQFLEVPVTR